MDLKQIVEKLKVKLQAGELTDSIIDELGVEIEKISAIKPDDKSGDILAELTKLLKVDKPEEIKDAVSGLSESEAKALGSLKGLQDTVAEIKGFYETEKTEKAKLLKEKTVKELIEGKKLKLSPLEIKGLLSETKENEKGGFDIGDKSIEDHIQAEFIDNKENIIDQEDKEEHNTKTPDKDDALVRDIMGLPPKE